MENLVSRRDDVILNIDTLFSYGESVSGTHERKFHDQRIKNGKNFVVLLKETEHRFAPSKFAGYASNNLEHIRKLSMRHGGRTDKQMTRLFGEPLEAGQYGYADIDQSFTRYCSEKNIKPSVSSRMRKYWIVSLSRSSFFPEEVDMDGIWEGAQVTVLVNRFERSRLARDKCLAHYGYACTACDVSLEQIYGPLGREFIHVHHVVPISSVGKGYKINPIKDLRPVCPNCHAIIHRYKETLSIDRLRELLQSN